MGDKIFLLLSRIAVSVLVNSSRGGKCVHLGAQYLTFIILTSIFSRSNFDHRLNSAQGPILELKFKLWPYIVPIFLGDIFTPIFFTKIFEFFTPTL